MYNTILVFAALAINECQGQCHFSMCVEVSDWVPKSPADQCMQICVWKTCRGTKADCFRLHVFSTTAAAPTHLWQKLHDKA